MDFNKLSQIKKGIIRSAYGWGYVTDNTYPREKQALYQKGWLQTRCIDNHQMISGQYELTPDAKTAYELMKGQGNG